MTTKPTKPAPRGRKRFITWKQAVEWMEKQPPRRRFKVYNSAKCPIGSVLRSLVHPDAVMMISEFNIGDGLMKAPKWAADASWAFYRFAWNRPTDFITASAALKILKGIK